MTVILAGSAPSRSTSSLRENWETVTRCTARRASAGSTRPLPGDVQPRVPRGLAQRGRVVDHDDVAREGERREVRRVEQQRARGAARRSQRQRALLPRVAGAVDERARRPDDLVARRVERGQARGELARPALDAAELGPGRGARVDEDGAGRALKVAVDARHLAGGPRGGALYAALLVALARASRRRVALSRRTSRRPPVERPAAALPSRALFGAAALTGRPRLDRARRRRATSCGCPRPRRSPSRRDVPYVLTVHDLSWVRAPAGLHARTSALWHAARAAARAGPRAPTRVVVDAEATRATRSRAGGSTRTASASSHPGVPRRARRARARRPAARRASSSSSARSSRARSPSCSSRRSALARARGLDAELVFAGDGRLAPSCAGRASTSLGRVDATLGAAVRAARSRSSCPSHLEGFGFPPLEARAARHAVDRQRPAGVPRDARRRRALRAPGDDGGAGRRAAARSRATPAPAPRRVGGRPAAARRSPGTTPPTRRTRSSPRRRAR